jgi:hypothetical protein
MLLTFADAHAMRPSGIQQIPYDANRSAVHPSDTSAADDRARTRCDMTTSSRKKKKNKIRKNRCRIAVSDFYEFRGILIDTPNPSIK